MISESELGHLIADHYRNLPRDVSGERPRSWPWVATFLVAPCALAAIVAVTGFAPSSAAAVGLLAGVGVLAGLLFQVLAWVGGRVAAIADRTNPEAPQAHDVDLISRLDYARQNVAYATLVAVLFTVWLGVVALLNDPPEWMTWVSAFLLFHFTATLLLVLVRINSIGRSDRVEALTKHARSKDRT